jgi:hypothetical protein
VTKTLEELADETLANGGQVRRTNSGQSDGGAEGTPIRETKIVMLDSNDPGYTNRILVGTPTRGTVRIEWYSAMRGLMTPPNWSTVSMTQMLPEFIPIRFTVADAQNLIVREVINRDFEWMLLIEDDTLPPPDLYLKLSKYMKEGPPVVSGLYFTKGVPSEPLIYRGRGNGAYTDWKMGQAVWCDGVPCGCLLVHAALLRAMWEDATEYTVAGQTTRDVFQTPTRAWVSPTGDVNTATGTSDLEWCSKIIDGGYLKKSGWGKYARKRWPFLVDTEILCGHISPDGQIFP